MLSLKVQNNFNYIDVLGDRIQIMHTNQQIGKTLK